jgi:hypothetical protein
MKPYFLVFLLYTLTYSSYGQLTYSFSPSKNVSSIAPLMETTEIKIDIYNTSNSKLLLNWIRVLNTLPSNWQYTTCDNVFCYGGVPSGLKTMDSIAIGGQSFLTLGIDPGNNLGAGQVKIYVYQDGFPNQGDTLTWNITSQAVGVNEISDNLGISIYPNPASTVLNLKFTKEFNQKIELIYLIDALGRKVIVTEFLNEDNTIDITDLNSGCYNLIIESENKKLFKKIVKLN